MEQAELEQTIEKARLDRSAVLDLTHNQLTSLPKSIGNLQSLVELYLGSNSLTVLPESIGNLANLKRLHLRDNKLTELPKSIGKLHKLTRLDIQYNQITTLPNSMVSLSRLIHLSVDDIFLQGSLFDEILPILRNIPKLETVNYPGQIDRHINNFSEWKHKWINNRYDDSTRNALIEKIGWDVFFEELGFDLIDLNLQGCNLENLPGNISSLSHLKTLNINNNPLTDLSPLILLSNLREVYFLGAYLEPRYWIKFSDWKSEWLLDEDNAEIRRVLIEQLGYEKICEDLNAISLDSWRGYSLLKVDDIEAVYDEEYGEELTDREPMLLLKMTCPSTQHIHILRVPPEMTSAEAAITWVNHGIHPDKFAVQT